MHEVPTGIRGVEPFSALLDGEHDADERRYLVEMREACESYLSEHRWVHEVRDYFWGTGVPPHVGVFLVNLVGEEAVDPWLWVVAGDLPPAYLVTDDAKTPQAALGLYCDLREEWVTAVRVGLPLEGLMPVDVPATQEHADMLAARIATLRRFLAQRDL